MGWGRCGLCVERLANEVEVSLNLSVPTERALCCALFPRFARLLLHKGLVPWSGLAWRLRSEGRCRSFGLASRQFLRKYFGFLGWLRD